MYVYIDWLDLWFELYQQVNKQIDRQYTSRHMYAQGRQTESLQILYVHNTYDRQTDKWIYRQISMQDINRQIERQNDRQSSQKCINRQIDGQMNI